MNTTAAAINRKIDAINRKANPAARDAGVFTNLDAPKNARTRYFRHASDEWALSHGFPYRLISQHEGEGAPVKFGKTRAYVAIDEGPDGSPVVETWRISGLQMWSGNPTHKRNPAGRSPYVLHKKPAKRFPRYTVEVLNGSQWWGRESMNSLDQARAEVLFLAGGGMEARVIDQKTGEDVTNEPRKNPTAKRAPRTVALLARKSNPAGDGGVSLAIGVNAGNDRNGNPRRGWIVLRVWNDKGRAGIARTGFVEEGLSGDTELRRLAGEIPTVDHFDISVSEYNRLRKGMGR